MPRHTLAALGAAVLGLALVPLAGASTSASAGGDTVTMSGTAYQFNTVHTMLGGATIHVAEDPDLTTTVAEDGTYSLELPDHATVTPYITKDGYGTIYLQTFRTNGQDLVNVNFQTPTIMVRDLLAQGLGIETDDDGYPTQCAVVTTVSTKQVRGVTYQQFIDWGAHGVAGVTATITPQVGNRFYFNEHVLPDPNQAKTSVDGGVVWTAVPPGKYTLAAHGAGSRWPDVHITCAAGRIVNANPPWGLNQRATTVPTQVRPTWAKGKRDVRRLAGLTVAAFPKQVLPAAAVGYGETIDFRGRITVGCTGSGCFAPKSVPGSMKKPVNLMTVLGKDAARLRPGRTLTVTLAVPGYNTRVDSWRIPAHGTPTRRTQCITLGWSRLQKTC
ncbi:hypothetical protein [Nocardioides sp.]|uniref:hypothetical protein n=1 Tax=Nocardioides sp. TaxID=35761 RepID=UPI003784C6D5